jgi:hypothetical protein
MTRPPLRLLAVGTVLVAAVLAVDAMPSRPSSRPVALARQGRVVGTLAVCPELLQAGRDVESRLTVGTAQPGRVTVNAAPLDPRGDEGPVVLDAGGQVGTFGKPGNSAVAVAATATGEQAGGVAVEQISRGSDGPQRGLAGVRCEPTVADSWFLGAATTINDQSQLILANPYDDVAVVRVELYTAAGKLNVPGTDGVEVPARTRVVKPLEKWAPSEKWLAVRVVAESGRVASAVRRSTELNLTPAGVDWVPRTGRPDETVTLSALPAGNGARWLLLLNPGRDPALVRVQVTTKDGSTVPTSLGQLEVPGGKLVAVPITEEVAQQPAVLGVFSDGPPVLAGAYAENRMAKTRIREFAFSGGSSPLTGPALLTDNRVGKGINTSLVLVAPEAAAEVTVSPVQVRGDPAPRDPPKRIPVPAGKLVLVSLAELTSSGDPRPVVVTPTGGSAPVYATRIIDEAGVRGPLFTILGVRSQPHDGLPMPPVHDDPAAWLAR